MTKKLNIFKLRSFPIFNLIQPNLFMKMTSGRLRSSLGDGELQCIGDIFQDNWLQLLQDGGLPN